MVKSSVLHGAVFGVALSATEVVIAPADGTAARTWSLPPLDDDNPEAWYSALRDAVREITREFARAGQARWRVALMPSLAEARMVALPPVNAADAARILSRSASRFFLDVREPLLLSIAPSIDAARRGPPASSPFSDTRAGVVATLPLRLAAASPAAIVQAINDAATAAGGRVECVVPAVSAWSMAVPSDRAAAVVSLPQHLELVTVHGGVPVAVRRFRSAGDEAALHDAIADIHAQVIGDEAGAAPVRIGDATVAAARALAIATVTSWPLAFVPGDVVRAETPRASRPVTAMLAAVGAVAVLAFAGVLGWEWRAGRVLDDVRAERARLAPRVEATAPMRVRLERARLLSPVPPADTIGWSRLLARLTEALPDDAYLTSLRTRGDTLFLEGRAARAGSVFDALRGVAGLAGVRASAPVRRETADDGTTLDRFAFTLQRGGR